MASGPRRKLTPERRAKAVAAVKLGMTRAQQAAYAGVSLSTLQKWLAKGRAAKGGALSKWADEMEESEAVAIARNLAVIMKAAREGTWQAAAWYLERKYPDDYGRRVPTIEVTQQVGVQVVEQTSQELLEIARERRLAGESPKLIAVNGDNDEEVE